MPNKIKTNTKNQPVKDRRYDRNEQSIHHALDRALSHRRINVRAREICRHARISSPTFYLHCRGSDDALKSYEAEIATDFAALLPVNPTSREVTFTILLQFLHQHQQYFSATLNNYNSWLLVQLFDAIKPSLVQTDISDKCYDIYIGSLSTLIFCWGKHEHFATTKIPLYTKKLVQVRIMDLGI